MSKEELRLEDEAFTFVKRNKRELISRFAKSDVCKPVSKPVSLFMAGSPGAGKTEVSKSLMKRFRDVPVRIDADEIRAMCPGYTGINAHVFQKAANKGVNILFDHALHKKLNLILDATFAYEDAPVNIRRSLERGRIVELWFVYQNPLKAWEVTKARERKETRHVSKDVFIDTFFKSKQNVHAVMEEFGNAIKLNLLVKDYDGNEKPYFNITGRELDRRLDDGYTKDELKAQLL